MRLLVLLAAARPAAGMGRRCCSQQQHVQHVHMMYMLYVLLLRYGKTQPDHPY